jgi:hypothetical protein
MRFGKNAATKLICSSTSSCTPTSPRAITGTVDVLVTVGGKTSAAVVADRFTYTR